MIGDCDWGIEGSQKLQRPSAQGVAHSATSTPPVCNRPIQSPIPKIERARPEGRARVVFPDLLSDYLKPNRTPMRMMRGFMISRILLKFVAVTSYCLPSVVAVLNRLKMSKSMFAV